MARTKSGSLPAYRIHKQSGQAIVTLPLPGGGRKDYLLGIYGSPESQREYGRLIDEWKAGEGKIAPSNGPSAATDLTLEEMVDLFSTTYLDTQCGEAERRDYRLSLFPVLTLFPHHPAAKFSPLCLEKVRDYMVKTGSGKSGTDANGKKWNNRVGKGLCRRVVNQRLGRIRRFFKWAASKEHIPASIFQALLSVDGLRAGRSAARESAPVPPVDDLVVNATLPYLTRPVAAMVRLQRLTGARPGEVVIMRPGDIDRGEREWVYRPAKHKTAYKGKVREIVIGPIGQAVLTPFLDRAADAYLFSPKEARAAWEAGRRKPESTAASRRVKNPKRRPRERYTVDTYGKAIRKACERKGIPLWHVHQLRHTFGTLVRKAHGVEAAQTALGHAALSATEVYAESNLAAAKQVAAAMG
jgi:integrase